MAFSLPNYHQRTRKKRYLRTLKQAQGRGRLPCSVSEDTKGRKSDEVDDHRLGQFESLDQTNRGLSQQRF